MPSVNVRIFVCMYACTHVCAYVCAYFLSKCVYLYACMLVIVRLKAVVLSQICAQVLRCSSAGGQVVRCRWSGAGGQVQVVRWSGAHVRVAVK